MTATLPIVKTEDGKNSLDDLRQEVFAFPMSFAQQRLWFLHRLEPDSPAYNVPAAYRLKGSLEVTALERSFDEIVRRHEVLHTTFVVIDSEPMQVVRRPAVG